MTEGAHGTRVRKAVSGPDEVIAINTVATVLRALGRGLMLVRLGNGAVWHVQEAAWTRIGFTMEARNE